MYQGPLKLTNLFFNRYSISFISIVYSARSYLVLTTEKLVLAANLLTICKNYSALL